MTPKPWYHKGLRFECTQCGQCCASNGEYEYLYLSDHDVAALAAQLGEDEATFRAQRCELEEGYTVLHTPGETCPFLGADRRCQVYAARPMQCRTWPFWQENLKQERWQGPVKAICPGIGKGPLYSAAEVERIARENEEWYEGEDDGRDPSRGS